MTKHLDQRRALSQVLHRATGGRRPVLDVQEEHCVFAAQVAQSSLWFPRKQ